MATPLKPKGRASKDDGATNDIRIDASNGKRSPLDIERQKTTPRGGPIGDGSGATREAGPSTGAHNFTKDPRSGALRTGGTNFHHTDGRSACPPPNDPIVARMPTSEGDGTDIAEESIPEDGTTTSCDGFDPANRGTGSVGNAHRPFKL